MKAISLWQPWASAWILPDLKGNETRGWSTSYRGPIAVHAAKTRQGFKELEGEWPYGWWGGIIDQLVPDCDGITPDPEVVALRANDAITKMPFGALIGVVHLIDCRRTEDCIYPQSLSEVRAATGPPGMIVTPREYAFGNYGPGRFAWIANRRRTFAEPIPWKGSQGFFDVPDEVVRAALNVTPAGLPSMEEAK